jgi:prepilin-type N-terminal cleavage/methylation domain-containing protein
MRLVAEDSREPRNENRGEASLERAASEAPPRGQLPGKRGAFTLIEMLLVLAIIAALAALLLAAVFRATLFGQGVGLANDVRQLDVGLQKFKDKFGFYPPSRIKLCKRQSDYSYWTTGGQMGKLEADSIFYLSKLAARITDNTATSPQPAGIGNGGVQTKSPWMCTADKGSGAGATLLANTDYIDWDQSNSYTSTLTTASPPAFSAAPAFITLEGDQCLVFFLGGIVLANAGSTPAPPFTCDGFSYDAFNPAKPRATPQEQRATFYNFDSPRLTLINYNDYISAGPVNNQIGSFVNRFPSYQDSQGTPLIYFSSYRLTNGYNRYFDANPTVQPTYSLGPWSDCHGQGVWPYAQANITPTSAIGGTLSLSPITFANPDTYQVICAGPDKKFGPGTARNVSTAAVTASGPLPATSACTVQGAPAFRAGQMVIIDIETPGSTEAVLVTSISSNTFQANFRTGHNPNVSVIGPFWTKATAGDVYAVDPITKKLVPGADDVSNFSEKALGTTVANQ